jgi:hypothetical protein
MMVSQEARRHFLVFFSGAEYDNEPGMLAVIYYI